LQKNDKAVLVYATFPSLEAAEQVGAALVDARLAACVNVIPGMVSIYLWKGERHRDGEVVMIAKTRAALTEEIVGEIRRRHSYENPAIVILPVEGGSDAYLAWIAAETARP
jgi:periplasmic divalent cation tolerance protein